MATREITDEQAGEIEAHLNLLQAIADWATTSEDAQDQATVALLEIRRLLGFV